ncbi:MAG: hypothetical protein EXR30_00575 [Betaproteobacteria bacterium]|nr:hypothetical protein [Betaproteobacteria bacterium]MSQ87908.1 hypothetical protein [Betaproteobacteria bacterium]
MGMPVKLSDQLVRRARREAVRSRRSITAQVEHWASLGRMAEKSIPTALVENVGRRGHAASHPVVSFLERISEADMRAAAERKLAFLNGPRYESDPDKRRGIVEVHDDGRRLRGAWDMKLNAFVPAAAPARRRK